MSNSSEISKFLTDQYLSSDKLQSFGEIKDSNIISKPQEEYVNDFYKLAKYYDKGFARDVSNDVAFFEYCFSKYSEREVKLVLEPACGPGLFLEFLAKRGYDTLGYDLSESMINYAKERLINASLYPKKSIVLVGDMRNMYFPKEFDASYICINSLGYLTKEEEIISHFIAMNRSLKKGGLYIVEISCMCENFGNERKVDDIWRVDDDNVELEFIWRIRNYDVEQRLRYVDFRMVLNEGRNQIIVEEVHELRLWLYEEFKRFIESTGFEIIGIYNQKYEEIDVSFPISGELGVLFYVLKNKW